MGYSDAILDDHKYCGWTQCVGHLHRGGFGFGFLFPPSITTEISRLMIFTDGILLNVHVMGLFVERVYYPRGEEDERVEAVVG